MLSELAASSVINSAAFDPMSQYSPSLWFHLALLGASFLLLWATLRRKPSRGPGRATWHKRRFARVAIRCLAVAILILSIWSLYLDTR
jgi:hypothetical protein